MRSKKTHTGQYSLIWSQAALSLGICLSVCSAAVLADHPTIAFGHEGSGAINTISANPLPAGSWGFGLRSEIINNDEFTGTQLENFAANGLEGVHSIDRITNTSLSFTYGITEDFVLTARLPYVQRKNIREGELEGGVPEAHVHGDSSGVGDLVLLGQYRILTQSNTDVSLLLGIKTPSGETDVKDVDGVRFETEFQPGTGAWDLLLGASISKKIGKLGYHANILYNKTTEGSQSTEIGDALFYNTAVTFGLNDSHAGHHHDHSHGAQTPGLQWGISLELNGETRRKNRVFGLSEANSGGTRIDLSPGIKVAYGKFGGFVSYVIPMIENQNGEQTDVDSRLVAGLSFAI